MKKFILLLVCTILFCSCHQSKTEMIKDFIEARNCYDKEKLSQYLMDDFISYSRDRTRNKNEFLSISDSNKIREQKYIMLKIQDLDSIVRTEEEVSNITDSLLEVSPKVIQKKTYRFYGYKLKSITLDTLLNFDENKKALEKKVIPFAYYLESNYPNESTYLPKMKKYLTEYANLPAFDKNKYRVYAYLQGTFVSDDNPFYRKLVFKGKRTVSIIDGIFGLSFATSYEVDENYIRIRTDQSDLLFEVVDENTLVGEGFAKGTFKKEN